MVLCRLVKPHSMQQHQTEATYEAIMHLYMQVSFSTCTWGPHTIKPAVSNKSTRYHWLRVFRSIAMCMSYWATIITGVLKIISSQLLNIPRIHITTMILKIVLKAVVHIPRRIKGFRDIKVDTTMTIWAIGSFIVRDVVNKVQIILTSSMSPDFWFITFYWTTICVVYFHIIKLLRRNKEIVYTYT